MNTGGNRPEVTLIKEYGDLPLVNCYPGQLNQVFFNIFTNAIDALYQFNMKLHIIEKANWINWNTHESSFRD
jgi:signal transduction histidine kinase